MVQTSAPFPLKQPVKSGPSNRSLAWLLFIATAIIFLPSLQYDQVGYDDNLYVFENPHVQRGLSSSGFPYAFTTFDGGSWMPATWLSLMLDTTLFGGKPSGYRFTNILLHCVNASLLLILLERLLKRRWLAFWIAAAFALHPLRTESVVWIAERKDVLSAFFMLLGLFFHTGHGHARSRAVLVTLAMVLGLMSKPMLVTFPFVLILVDWFTANQSPGPTPKLRPFLARQALAKAPLLLIVLLMAAVTFVTQKQSGAVSGLGDSLATKLLQVASNHGFYLVKLVCPFDRAVVYPEQPGLLLNGAVWLVVILGVSAWAWVKRPRHPWFAFGWFWFLITLLPVNGLVRVGMAPVADRYTYIPGIGIFLVLAFAVTGFAAARPALARILPATTVLTLGGMLAMTLADLPRWRDAGALFQAAIVNHPTKVSLNNLAYFRIGERRFPEAVELSGRAITIDPRYPQSYANRSLALAWQGDYERAKADYDQAVKLGARPIQPERLRALIPELRNVQLPQTHNAEEEWHVFAIAFRLQPRTAESFAGRATMRAHWGDLAGAIEDYTRAIQAAPGNSGFYHERAILHLKTGNPQAARQDIALCRAHGGAPSEQLLNALNQVPPPSK